jgi:hypothetical protein
VGRSVARGPVPVSPVQSLFYVGNDRRQTLRRRAVAAFNRLLREARDNVVLWIEVRPTCDRPGRCQRRGARRAGMRAIARGEARASGGPSGVRGSGRFTCGVRPAYAARFGQAVN